MLVIHSRDDEVIPFWHGEALYRAAAEPKTSAWISGGHNETSWQREYWEALAAWIAQLPSRQG